MEENKFKYVCSREHIDPDDEEMGQIEWMDVNPEKSNCPVCGNVVQRISTPLVENPEKIETNTTIIHPSTDLPTTIQVHKSTVEKLKDRLRKGESYESWILKKLEEDSD